MGRTWKLKDHLSEANDTFLGISMRWENHIFNKCQNSEKRGSRLYPITLKLTYRMDVGGIVQHELMTSEIDTESLGKSVEFLSSADVRPDCD